MKRLLSSFFVKSASRTLLLGFLTFLLIFASFVFHAFFIDRQNVPPFTLVSNSQGDVIKVKTKEFEDDKELILLISPLGRAGSSWLGEILMASHESVAYIYEPDKIFQAVFKTAVEDHRNIEIISDALACRMKSHMINLREVFHSVFKHLSKNCHPPCETINDYNKECMKSDTVVVKTIRLTFSAVEQLLSMRSLQHLKVIYLARDPRAQILSRMRAFRKKREDNTITDGCQIVSSAVQAFHKLSKMYPGQLYLLRYEDMCRDPTGEGTSLWKFLKSKSTATIPKSWRNYITKHNKALQRAENTKRNPFSLFRKTSTEWEKWRQDIDTFINITAIEDECGGAMDYLGYLPLGTVKNVKNLSIPFLGDMDCDFLNCWAYKF